MKKYIFVICMLVSCFSRAKDPTSFFSFSLCDGEHVTFSELHVTDSSNIVTDSLHIYRVTAYKVDFRGTHYGKGNKLLLGGELTIQNKTFRVFPPSLTNTWFSGKEGPFPHPFPKAIGIVGFGGIYIFIIEKKNIKEPMQLVVNVSGGSTFLNVPFKSGVFEIDGNNDNHRNNARALGDITPKELKSDCVFP